MSEKRTNNWSDPDTVRMLYLSVLAQTDNVTYSAQKIADFMGITYKAAHHQIARVKADVQALQNGTYIPLTSTPATPSASTTTSFSTTTTTKPNTRKRGAARISSEDPATDSIETSSPAKKVKTSTRSRSQRLSAIAAAIKEKEKSGDEDASNGDDERESAEEAAAILIAMSKGKALVKNDTAVVQKDHDSTDEEEMEGADDKIAE